MALTHLRLSDYSDRPCREAASINSTGYGQVKVAGRNRRAHRVAWEQAHGPIPEGMFVLHRCDNPACVELEHLFLGTHQDNMDDMVAKGRGRGGRGYPGEGNGRARMTWESVRELRQLRAEGLSYTALGERYGIDRRTAQAIGSGRLWREG